MSKYFNKLESLRGFAAIAVVLYHSPFFWANNPHKFVASSYLFVDFFFILSGFVMTSAYQEKIQEGFKFRDYFLLRLGRIYPLHLILLSSWAIYIFIKWILYSYQIEHLNPLLKNTAESFISNLLLIHSLNFHPHTSWNYPSWSISLEFLTYFLFFGFVTLTKRWRNPIFALIICLCSYFYVFNLHNWQTIDLTVINGIYRCVGGFFAGVFLFQTFAKFTRLNIYLTFILEIICLALVFWTVSNASENKTVLFLTLPVFVFTIFVFSQSNDGLVGKILQTKPFISAGKYSYSIYLSHALILDIAFSLTKYFFLKPEKEMFFLQSDWSILMNIGLLLIIFGVSKITYETIEKRWIEKSKKLVADLNTFDKIKEEKSILI